MLYAIESGYSGWLGGLNPCWGGYILPNSCKIRQKSASITSDYRHLVLRHEDFTRKARKSAKNY